MNATATTTRYFATYNGKRCTEAFATKREASLYVTRNNRAAMTARGVQPYAVEVEVEQP